MKPKRRSFFETLAVHGLPPSHAQGPDLAPSIRLSSTFRFESAEQAAGVFDGSEDGYVYSRIANPTVDQLQEKIAVLEKGEAAVAVASGMAAIASTALTLARPGDNFVSCTTVYGGTFAFFHRDLARLDIEARFIPPAPDLSVAKLDELIDAKTRFLYMETPANPTLDILDIEKWAGCAISHRIPLIVDNTFATPYLQSPLSLGAEGVIHSATKYLGGHADCIGGVVVGHRDLIERMKEVYIHHFGPVMSPFTAWQILRGIKTLVVRMDRHCINADRVARFLNGHPKVERVFYPGLSSDPGHAVATRQMKQFGGMLAFEVSGGVEAGKTVMNNVSLCTLAVSLGDCDTLIQHPASMTHSPYPREKRLKAGITDGLIRLSVGIENADDIIADIDGALARA
ncbi:MAG: aminotransferase class I/II-fold pyridoxal phosphate-dependent enzyme [Thermodesulfobacteriota bacterium]|nr:aminotransferase class I/II-fold pyridoxal phosphate-dependent enzyme [Thermodesulfobacteriota bacterium]